MKIPDYKELYKPYSKQASLEITIGWVLDECKKKGIDVALGNKAINMTFLEMAKGKTFPTDGKGTGFKGYQHAALNIYIMTLAVAMHNKSMKAYFEATEGEIQARIKTYVSRNKNREYWDHLKRDSIVTKGVVKVINLTAGKDKEWILSL